MTTAVLTRLDEVIQLIPGYDPVATAGECWFDDEAAQLALDFFPECLRHVKGALAGQPFELGLWQQAIVANTFGWKRPDGTRRYRMVLVFVPRKNGKTTLGAGVGNYMLFCEGEPGADIFSAAADRMQAGIVFEHARGMVMQCPEMHKRCVIYGGVAGQQKAIVLKDYSGSWKVLSSDAGTKHGLNVQLAIEDELHAHKNRELHDVLVTGTGSRRQPLILILTTSDYERESICNEIHDYASKVRDGIIDDPSFLPAIWEASVDDDWTDEAVWAQANPNLGVSVSLDYLRQEFKRAQEVPAYENVVKRLHLNIRTEQATRIIPMAEWDACADAVDVEALKGRPCFGGLDLSSTTDLSAFVLIFPEDEYAVLPWFWVPQDRAPERERRDKVPYLTWARQGLIEMTPGNVIDYAYIRKQVNELAQTYSMQSIGYDPWNATQIAVQLKEQDGLDMVLFRQGFQSMNEPTKWLLALIKSGQLRHGGHPVLRWMASNAAGRTDPADSLKFDKAASSDRIDGIVALTMALGVSMVGGGPKASVYEERGVLTV